MEDAEKTKAVRQSRQVLKYVKVGDAWRFANIIERSGRVVRDHVVISGRDEQHTEGTYYLEWYVLDNRRRLKAVPNFSELISELIEEARRKSIEIEAMRAGVMTPPANVGQGVSTARMRVTTAIDTYFDYVKHNRADHTYLTYRYTLDVLLRQSCATPFVEDISPEDILKFITDCYKLGLGGRTVYDKRVVVLQMFNRYGRTKLIESRVIEKPTGHQGSVPRSANGDTTDSKPELTQHCAHGI